MKQEKYFDRKNAGPGAKHWIRLFISFVWGRSCYFYCILDGVQIKSSILHEQKSQSTHRYLESNLLVFGYTMKCVRNKAEAHYEWNSKARLEKCGVSTRSSALGFGWGKVLNLCPDPAKIQRAARALNGINNHRETETIYRRTLTPQRSLQKSHIRQKKGRREE